MAGRKQTRIQGPPHVLAWVGSWQGRRRLLESSQEALKIMPGERSPDACPALPCPALPVSGGGVSGPLRVPLPGSRAVCSLSSVLRLLSLQGHGSAQAPSFANCSQSLRDESWEQGRPKARGARPACRGAVDPTVWSLAWFFGGHVALDPLKAPRGDCPGCCQKRVPSRNMARGK